jgi:hypothetical protein
VRGPRGASQARTQGILQLPVEPLDQPIGLRVVSGGLNVLDAQGVAEAVPEGRGELAPPA